MSDLRFIHLHGFFLPNQAFLRLAISKWIIFSLTYLADVFVQSDESFQGQRAGSAHVPLAAAVKGPGQGPKDMITLPATEIRTHNQDTDPWNAELYINPASNAVCTLSTFS